MSTPGDFSARATFPFSPSPGGISWRKVLLDDACKSKRYNDVHSYGQVPTGTGKNKYTVIDSWPTVKRHNQLKDK